MSRLEREVTHRRRTRTPHLDATLAQSPAPRHCLNMSKKSHKHTSQHPQHQHQNQPHQHQQKPPETPDTNLDSDQRGVVSRDRKRARLAPEGERAQVEEQPTRDEAHRMRPAQELSSAVLPTVQADDEVAADQKNSLSVQQDAPLKSGAEPNICAACARPIKERYLLMALDKQWHEDCLKCACCDCRLGEVGSSLYTHSDKILCRRDFLRIFGQHGLCAACKRSIPPYELVMRAHDNAYHLECFACQQCQYRFCVGDKFLLTDAHKIVCLLCHREQLQSGAETLQEQQQQHGQAPEQEEEQQQQHQHLQQQPQDHQKQRPPPQPHQQQHPQASPPGNQFAQIDSLQPANDQLVGEISAPELTLIGGGGGGHDGEDVEQHQIAQLPSVEVEQDAIDPDATLDDIDAAVGQTQLTLTSPPDRQPQQQQHSQQPKQQHQQQSAPPTSCPLQHQQPHQSQASSQQKQEQACAM